MKKRILILGATGSVGKNVLDVVAHHPDRFEVVGLSAFRSVEVLAAHCATHRGARFVIGDADSEARLLSEHFELESRLVRGTRNNLVTLIDATEPDLVVNCLVGFMGLEPTLHALSSGVPVALANKESVVAGGELIRDACRGNGARIIPIDSEHVAISQCLRGCEPDDVDAVYITASGGALRDRSVESIAHATREDVLAHPTWDMGEKITVDSATLLNKGLEVIEAHWLFDLPFDRIKVVIHPQSIVHSLVEFRDNSILAQMGVPDMRLPILYALTYPERIDTPLARSCITDFPELTFEPVDEGRYPCFKCAIEAGRRGGNAPTVLNSANEVAVGAFLAEKIKFSSIYSMVEAALSGVAFGEIRTFTDVAETDTMTRAYIKEKFGV